MERLLPTSYALVFLWSLAVLLGLTGLGRLLARLVGGEAAAQAGWGLHAVWGMGVYLFLGGALALVGWADALGLSLLIGAGLAGLLWTTARGGWPTRAAVAALPWQTWPVWAVLALVYAGGLCWQGNVNWCDDLAAYYTFCEKLLATGSFDEPFSWRRLASLGGHTLLQASVLANGSYANAQAFERSLCPALLLGLVLGFRQGALARTPLGLLLGFIAISTPLVRMNTTSHLTGTVLLVGLFVTLDLVERAGAQRRRLLAVAGLVAAGLCSLRAQDVAAAGGALGFFWLAAWLKDRQPWRDAAREAACWGGALFFALLPWMLMALRSNGTPLFPLFPGTNNLAFNPQSLPGPLYARLAPPMDMLLHPALLPLLLALLALPAWRSAVAARALAFAAVATALALAYGVGLAPDAMTIPRYVQPLLLAGALAALLSAAVRPRGRMAAWALGALLLALGLPERAHELGNHYRALSHLEKIIVPFNARTIADYREAQLLVPEGRRILVCADFPYLFDHARNPLWTIDLPHACSPAPGLPFQRPPAETKRYLRDLGVEYLIVVDFSRSLELYSRASWQKHAAGDIALWKIQSPFYLDFFATAEGLAATEKQLGKVGPLTVLQLHP